MGAAGTHGAAIAQRHLRDPESGTDRIVARFGNFGVGARDAGKQRPGGVAGQYRALGEQALGKSGVSLAELTPEIAIESVHLPGNLPGDPADRMIVATARILGATLLTKDRRLIEYSQGRHVRVLAA
jgi:hypothetical protein